MALEKKIQDFKLAQSIDSHTDPKLTQGNLQLVNGLISHEGTVSKSPGTEMYPKNVLPRNGSSNGSAYDTMLSGMCVFPSESQGDLKIIGQSIDVSNPTHPRPFQGHAWDSAANAWRPIGVATPCSVGLQIAPRIMSQSGAIPTISVCDAIVGHDYILYIAGIVGDITNGFFGVIASRKTGAIISGPTAIQLTTSYTGQSQRLAADYVSDGVGGWRFLVASPATGANGEYWSWNPKSTAAIPLTPSSMGITTFPDFVFASCALEHDINSGVQRSLIITTHVQNGLNLDLYIYRVNPTTGALITLGHQASIDTWAHRAVNQNQICVNSYWSQTLGALTSANQRIGVFYVGNSSFSIFFDGAGGTIANHSFSGIDLPIGMAGYSNQAGGIIVGYKSSTDLTTVQKFDDTGASVAVTASPLIDSAVLACGSPFAVGGRIYCPMARIPDSIAAPFLVQAQGHLYELSFELDRLGAFSIGLFAMGALALDGKSNTASQPCAVAYTRPDRQQPNLFYLGIDYERRVDKNGNTDLVPAYCSFQLDQAAPSFAIRNSRAGKSTTIALPGLPRFYDGGLQPEFDAFNDGNEVSIPVDGAAGNVTAGVHYVCIVWEWYDRLGLRHQTAPSQTVNWTAAGSKLATVTASGSCGIEPTNYNTPLSSADLAKNRDVQIVAYMTIAGDTVNFYRAASYQTNGNSTVTLTLNLSDTNLANQEKLYSPPTASTNAGQLAALPPPTAKLIMADEQRQYLVPTDDASNIWFSQVIIDGWGVQWSPLLTVRIPGEGDIVGLAAQDGNKIVFKQTAIYGFTGLGPDNTGSTALQSFTTPRKLPGSPGCSDPPSVLQTPAGIFYKAVPGIFMFDRQLGVQFVGKEVERYKNNHVLASSRALDDQRAYFVIDNGQVLVYDWHHMVWSVLSYQYPLVHGQFVGSQFTGITADGSVLQDNPARTNSQQMLIETCWYKLANIAGYERIFEFVILGDYQTGSRLQVQMSYDYDPTIVETSVVTATGALGGGPGALFRVVPFRQKCTAMKLIITDFPQDQTTINLNGITMVLGIDTERAARVPVALQG